jgi:hypothetical protein
MTQSAPDEFKAIFPTLVLKRWAAGADAMNPRLREVILDKREQVPGIQRSNVGGWHSELDLLTWQDDSILWLRDHVRGAVRDYWSAANPRAKGGFQMAASISAWAMVSQPGDYGTPHVHPNSTLSGVYYVDAGTSEPDHRQSGRLCLKRRCSLKRQSLAAALRSRHQR